MLLNIKQNYSIMRRIYQYILSSNNNYMKCQGMEFNQQAEKVFALILILV